MAESRPVTGLFRDRDSAERAYQAVIDRGYGRGDVDLVMSDETRTRHFGSTPDGRTTELGTKAAEGAGIGGAIGGTVGAIAAAVAAVGTSIALPGLGLVMCIGAGVVIATGDLSTGENLVAVLVFTVLSGVSVAAPSSGSPSRVTG